MNGSRFFFLGFLQSYAECFPFLTRAKLVVFLVCFCARTGDPIKMTWYWSRALTDAKAGKNEELNDVSRASDFAAAIARATPTHEELELFGEVLSKKN